MNVGVPPLGGDRAGRHTRYCSRDRRGVSLIETMVAVSVSATILLVAIGWIHQSFKLAKTVKQKQQHHQQLIRLGDQFRQDVRLCQQVSRDADGRWVLRNSQRGDVVYEVDKATVSRAYLSTAAEKTHHETYSLMSGSDVRWDDSELPQWITLTITRSSGVAARTDGSRADAPVDLRVRVAVGRWLVPPILVASNEETGR
jgi:prepilin-type N-terminal cleavage/methylation domain-containing protein